MGSEEPNGIEGFWGARPIYFHRRVRDEHFFEVHQCRWQDSSNVCCGGNDYTFSLRKCLFGSFPDFESDQRCLEYHQPCCYGFFTARYKQEYTLRRLFSGARFGLPTKMPAEGYIQTAELATWATDANKPERSLEKNMKARFLLVTAFALSFVSQSSEPAMAGVDCEPQ